MRFSANRAFAFPDATVVIGYMSPIAAHTDYGVYVDACRDDKGKPLGFKGTWFGWAKEMGFALEFEPASTDATFVTFAVRFYARGEPSIQAMTNTLELEAPPPSGYFPTALRRFVAESLIGRTGAP